MKKVFTLLIMALVSVVSTVYAGQRIVFLGNFALGYSNDKMVKIPASSFKNLQTGDVVTLLVTSDEYCKPMDNSWNEFGVPANALHNKFQFEVTDDIKSKLQEGGLYIQGSTTLTMVEYGTGSTPTVLYTNGEGYQINEKWGNSFDTFNDYDFSTVALGDELTFTVECTAATGDWHPLVIRNKDNGSNYLQYNTYGQTTITATVTAELMSILKGNCDITGDQFKLKGISYRHDDYVYVLNAFYNGVGLSVINGESVNVELYRTFDWNSTICLPFEVPSVSSAFDATLGTTKVFEFSEYNNGLVFTEREHIKAGVPYYMERAYNKSIDDKSATITFEGVTINTEPVNSSESEGLTFKGNYTPGMDMENKYGVAYVDDSWGFYKGASGSNLNAFSAYFEGSIPAAPAARLSIIIDEEVNGINEVQQSISSNHYYTINGMRIDKPTKKGLYILNEKKVIIK